MFIYIPDIETSFQGFHSVARLYHDGVNSPEESIVFDFSRAKRIDSNMCSCLGAVIELLRCKSGKNLVVQPGDQSRLNLTLSKNGFYKAFVGKKLLDDPYETTIDYMKFSISKILGFREYIDAFFGKNNKAMPRMSDRLLERFRKSLGEVFENAKQHSESALGFFACGQLFPSENRLAFTMTDLGIGFEEHIAKHTGKRLKAQESIHWALAGENSARPRSEGKSGGLGLKLIRDFIQRNGGGMYIVSDRGYFEHPARGGERFQSLDIPFPGTVVTLDIRTDDEHVYDERDFEITEKNIF